MIHDRIVNPVRAKRSGISKIKYLHGCNPSRKNVRSREIGITRYINCNINCITSNQVDYCLRIEARDIAKYVATPLNVFTHFRFIIGVKGISENLKALTVM